MRPSRLIRIGDAVSQFFNVLIFNGDPNYSISGDAYRFGRHRLRRLIDALFWFDPDHCRVSHENDVRKGCEICKQNAST